MTCPPCTNDCREGRTCPARDIKAHIKEALAQTQEQRPWIGLTIEEIAACCTESTTTQLSFYNAIETKLKERNT